MILLSFHKHKMLDNFDKMLTRSETKKLEGYNTELSLSFLEATIKISILKHLYRDIKEQNKETDFKTDFKIKSYLKNLGKELKSKDIELQIEYKEIDHQTLTEKQKLYIGSIETTNKLFKDIIKDILKNSKEDGFCILKHLKMKIKEQEELYVSVFKDLNKVSTILKKNKINKDVDNRGNIKDLIDYSYDDHDEFTSKQKIKDYGKYVHRLKGKELDEFVLREMKTINKQIKKDIEPEHIQTKYDLYSSSDDSSYETESSSSEDEDYNTEEEELLELMGDEWNKKDLDYIKLRHSSNDKKKDIQYFSDLPENKKDNTLELIGKINKMNDEDKPLLFKVIDSGMCLNNKAKVIKKMEGIESNGFVDDFKLKSWIEGLLSIPFGIYKTEKVSKSSSTKSIQKYLNKCKKTLDRAVYGHNDAKRHILQILAQNINNENSKGTIFGIQGPMGNGKTTLVEQGIAKALNRPFEFISLGGATDASYLEGYGYTYEGSIYGKIVEVLMKSKCMNPIIYFDELDKVSETPKGDEIINILMHLTDTSQNNHFNDKYFQGIDFDLSKAIIVFSYNDSSKINPILRDRIVNIRTKGFKNKDKIKIANNYLIPKIMDDVGLNIGDININESSIVSMMESYTQEGGVRKLKELLYEITREINLRQLTADKLFDKTVKYPFIITQEIIQHLFENKYEYKPDKISDISKVGVVNGLYATTNDTGGLTVIEALPIPTSDKLGLELTGQQGDVMKESMKVSKTIAWNILPDNIKEEYQTKWKTGVSGIHIHCPEGATPKDGPSAGGAITTSIISLLTNTKIRNDIAMTGEINLSGQITEIGGLDSKLSGAKKAGVKLVLIPKDNEKDLKKIMKEDPRLIEQDVFDVKIVSDIYQILEYSLVKNNIKFKGCSMKQNNKKK